MGSSLVLKIVDFFVFWLKCTRFGPLRSFLSRSLWLSVLMPMCWALRHLFKFVFGDRSACSVPAMGPSSFCIVLPDVHDLFTDSLYYCMAWSILVCDPLHRSLDQASFKTTINNFIKFDYAWFCFCHDFTLLIFLLIILPSNILLPVHFR